MQPTPLSLPPSSFYFVHFVVFGLHIASGVYYFAMLLLYLYLGAHPGILRNSRFLEVHSFPFFPAVYALSGSIAAFHSLLAVRLVWKLITTVQVSPDPQQRPCLSKPPRSIVMATSAMALLRSESVLEVTLLVQIALQTFQACKVSHLISSQSINTLYVAIVVLSSWSMALFKLLPSHQRHIHCYLLVLDTLLSISAMAIPVVIFLPTYFDFDPALQGFSTSKYPMDTWQAARTAENQLVFVTSFFDLLSKMTPGASLLPTLSAVTNSLKCQERRANTKRTSTVIKVERVQVEISLPAHKSRVRSMWHTTLSIVLFVLGGTILAFHLHATIRTANTSDRGCLREMQPWLSREYTCEVLEVSCTQKKFTGSLDEIDSALQRVRAATVRGLIFSHCAALEIPPRIQTFPRLGILKVYNSTIVSWERTASITNTLHPELNQVSLLLTNMATIPPGLLSPDFPRGIFAMIICGSNLTGLPGEAVDAWDHLGILGIENTPSLTSIPDIVGRLNQLRLLSFMANSISQLPAELFVNQSFDTAFFAENPIVALPRVAPPPTLRLLDVSQTLVSKIPQEWFDESAENIVLQAAGSPVCDGRDAQPTEGRRVTVLCQESMKGSIGICMFREEAEWRAPNRT